MVKTAQPSRSSASTTQSSSLYDRLREDLLSAKFSPGTKLAIESLSDLYQAGQTPLREALNRLIADGLVERRDQRGFVAAGISRQDLQELTDTRCWLEEVAIRQGMLRRDPDWEEALVLAHHRLRRTPRSLQDQQFEDNAEWEVSHRRFHRALIQGCGSRWLIGFCEQLADQLYRYRKLVAETTYFHRDQGSEHAQIVEAILAGNADQAIHQLSAHYQATTKLILESEEIYWPEDPEATR